MTPREFEALTRVHSDALIRRDLLGAQHLAAYINCHSDKNADRIDPEALIPEMRRTPTTEAEHVHMAKTHIEAARRAKERAK